MDRKKVNSSMFSSVGYDVGSGILEVEFQPRKGQSTGNIYQYHGVPVEVWHGFNKAISHGKYFGEHIRDKYETSKVEDKTSEASA